MRQLAPEYLRRLLEGGEERRNLEFKSPVSWKDKQSQWLVERIVRGILGLSNTPSGGVLIVGIEEGGIGGVTVKGMSTENLESFGNFEAFKGYVDGFASTATAFDVGVGVFDDVKLLSFQVSEFERRPIICRKNGQTANVLREDDIYVRSLRAPYSTIRATAEELEEIIDLAVDKESHRLASRGLRREGQKRFEETYRDEIRDLD